MICKHLAWYYYSPTVFLKHSCKNPRLNNKLYEEHGIKPKLTEGNDLKCPNIVSMLHHSDRFGYAFNIATRKMSVHGKSA